MFNTVNLIFENDNEKQTFLSLSQNELKEFSIDISELLKKTNEEMKKAGIYEGHHYANQRLDKKYFRVELFVDFTPKKQKTIIMRQFRELSIDQYLDSMIYDKFLKKEGFIRLIP